MLRGRLLTGLAIGMSLLTVGCGGAADSPGSILGQFQTDKSAAKKKYEGKTVRLSVDKVTTVTKTTVNAVEYVLVQGKVGDTIIIDATFADPAEKSQALALKIGEPAIFEGEIGEVVGETRGYGALFMKASKVVPK